MASAATVNGIPSPLPRCPKRFYLTRGDAKRAARSLATTTPLYDGLPVHGFRCPLCAYYHVGHVAEVRHVDDRASSIAHVPGRLEIGPVLSPDGGVTCRG
jgi:hypothetical protein